MSDHLSTPWSAAARAPHSKELLVFSFFAVACYTCTYSRNLFFQFPTFFLSLAIVWANPESRSWLLNS